MDVGCESDEDGRHGSWDCVVSACGKHHHQSISLMSIIIIVRSIDLLGEHHHQSISLVSIIINRSA